MPLGLPRASRRGAQSYVLFVCLSLVARMLMPYGDEPDFTVRSTEAVSIDSGLFSNPYAALRGILPEPNLASDCLIQAEPLGLLATIRGPDCTESPQSELRRLVWIILITLPVGIAIIFRQAVAGIARRVGAASDDSEIALRLDVLGASLILPASIYYFGVFSVEPFVLSIGFLAFLFFGSWVIISGLFVYAATIDLGNSALMAGCYLTIMGLWLIYRRYGGVACLFVALSAAFVAYLLNQSLLTSLLMLASRGPLTEKGLAILTKLSGSDYYTKYPLLLRPVVTFMTSSFMTPSFVKVPVLFVVFGLSVGHLAVRELKSLLTKQRPLHGTHRTASLSNEGFRSIAFFGAIASVVIIGFLLPPYVNFKYFAFLTPFIMVAAVSRYGAKSMLLFGCFADVLVFAHLLAYRYA
jgi:hypothetical protein